jgi:hypothetical protein
MVEQAGPKCRVCGRPIEMRHDTTGGHSTNLSHWSHLGTDEGAQADLDHDALR